MSDLQLFKGNEAAAEAAVRAGCRYFFGYPITPQNELPEYLSWRLPEVGGVFLQAESEVAAINMVYGAAGAGARAMTSSSSPGISLKQEGISYIAGAELPCVIINMMRGGPGLGGIQPAQSDYFQATRGGGHGDYRTVVLGPAGLQELVDLTYEAFDIADRYRNPVMVLGDGVMGQMMEPVRFPPMKDPEDLPARDWATTGKRGRKSRNLVKSLYLDPEELMEHNLKLDRKYRLISERETRWELSDAEDAEWIFVAYGTTARIVRKVIADMRREGLRVGLLRPISLWPFPEEAFRGLDGQVRGYFTVEMSMGQMVEDVRLSAGGVPVGFYGTAGGVIPDYRDIRRKAEEFIREAGGSQ
ncbi:MAG: 3-methyl-2-oxobutanoate dehydrogenase subunit VorB [Bacillota bacterium]